MKNQIAALTFLLVVGVSSSLQVAHADTLIAQDGAARTLQSVVQDGSDRSLNTVAQDGAARTLQSVAQDGSDRSLNTVAQDGADRTLNNAA